MAEVRIYDGESIAIASAWFKDAWGLPAVRVTYSYHDDDLKTLRFSEQRQIEILEAAGAKKIWTYPYDEPGGTAHA